jgi:MFS family permease
MSSGPSQQATSVENVSPPAYSWYALLVLTLVYVLNFLDRMVIYIYILFTPIKAEMQFSDFQLAVLGTTSFVIFYTLLGVPFGRLTDRVSRKNLIAGGLAVWSLFSGLTGFADSFWTLFLCRLMVGVGEATLGPAALSLLSDYFPPRLRATVQGIYSSGIAIGGGLAFFLGGWIGQTHGWRTAFYLLGFPGLDRFRRRGKGGRMAFAAWAALASVPLWLGLLFSNHMGALLFVSALLYGLALIWVAPATADLHETAGPHLRGLASASSSRRFTSSPTWWAPLSSASSTTGSAWPRIPAR